MHFVQMPYRGGDFRAQLLGFAASSKRPEAACGKMLLELVEYLETQVQTPQVMASLRTNVLELRVAGTDTFANVWVDWNDYGEDRDGLPVMHYRMQISRPLERSLSEDLRMTEPAEVERVILNLLR
jgi:hypothetical protein